MLIFLPLIFLFTLWRAKFDTKLLWALDALASLLVIVWLFQFGSWGWFSYYLRYLWVILFIYTFVASYFKVKDRPFTKKIKGFEYMTIVVYIVLIFVFGLYNYQAGKTYTYKGEAIELDFPMNEGTYIIGQGGNGTMLNYHSAYDNQKYALDILKINALGMRAKGIYPHDKGKYEIYSDTIYSPCDGTIISAENNLEDFTPPNSDPEHPAGNHVTMQCDGVDADILLAHMKKGSVQVDVGDTVQKRQPLGKIGNYSNTTETHLHIHD